jgi:hypothetical protein
MSDPRFLSNTKPNNEVVDLSQRMLAGALRGDPRLIMVVAVNAVNEVEFEIAGDCSEVRSNILLAGLVRATNKLLKQV